MKYLLLIVALAFPAITYAVRFDFTNGQPAIMDDGVTGDTFEQTRYDFTNGQPTPVLDTTAVDESVVPETERFIVVNNGRIVVNNGKIVVQ